jgi:hypothetical protein
MVTMCVCFFLVRCAVLGRRVCLGWRCPFSFAVDLVGFSFVVLRFAFVALIVALAVTPIVARIVCASGAGLSFRSGDDLFGLSYFFRAF